MYSRMGLLVALGLLALTGCTRQISQAPVPSPRLPETPAPVASVPAAPQRTHPEFRPYAPLHLGAVTKALPPPILTFADGHREYQIDPRDRQGMPAGPLSPDTDPPVIAQGHVALRGFTLNIAESSGEGTVLDGTVQVFDQGPYDVTDLQVCVRINGELYVVVPPQAGSPMMAGNPNLPIKPGAASIFRIHAAVPFAFDPRTTRHTLYLEAQLDGPPGLVSDERAPNLIEGRP